MILPSPLSSVTKPLVDRRFPIDSSTPSVGSKKFSVSTFPPHPNLSSGYSCGCLRSALPPPLLKGIAGRDRAVWILTASWHTSNLVVPMDGDINRGSRMFHLPWSQFTCLCFSCEGVDRGWTRPPVHGSVVRGLTAVVRVPPMAAAGTFVW